MELLIIRGFECVAKILHQLCESESIREYGCLCRLHDHDEDLNLINIKCINFYSKVYIFNFQHFLFNLSVFKEIIIYIIAVAILFHYIVAMKFFNFQNLVFFEQASII